MLDEQPGTPENLPAPGSHSFNNKGRLVLIGIVFALALAYLIFAAFPGNTLYYLTVDEFLADEQNLDGRNLRVVGKLVPDSFQRVKGTTQANFSITEQGIVLASTYVGVVPDLFFNPHSDVVLEGSYGEGGVFQTDTIIVKCPSKYQAQQEEA